MENITKNCPACQESFLTLINKQICCSKGCSNTYRASKIKRPSCAKCGKIVNRRLSHCRDIVYCDKKCEAEARNKQIVKNCVICRKEISVRPSQINRKYCSRKCMGVDVRKRVILRSPQYRSFGECVLSVLLKKNGIDVIVCDRKILDGFEIDIWIPSLNTGIEYNGIHHFKPVYGEKVYEKTLKSDAAKRAIAHKKGIKIIDINVVKSISPTCKTAFIEPFLKICESLKLNFHTTDFTKEEILKEQGKI